MGDRPADSQASLASDAFLRPIARDVITITRVLMCPSTRYNDRCASHNLTLKRMLLSAAHPSLRSSRDA